MHPVLFQFGTTVVYTYGFALTIGAIISTFLIWRRSHKLGFPDESIIDMVLISLLISLILSRIVYVIYHGNEFAGSVLRMLDIPYFPGFNGPTALIGGLLGCLVFALYKRWPLKPLFDCVVFGLTLGISVVMLGAFFAGNFVGSVTNSSLGVVFPGYKELRHPVGLYYALYSIVLFIVLVFVDRTKRRDGLLTVLFMILFGLALIVLEWYTNTGIVIYSVHLNQLIGFIGIVLGVLMFYSVYKDVLITKKTV